MQLQQIMNDRDFRLSIGRLMQAAGMSKRALYSDTVQGPLELNKPNSGCAQVG